MTKEQVIKLRNDFKTSNVCYFCYLEGFVKQNLFYLYAQAENYCKTHTKVELRPFTDMWERCGTLFYCCYFATYRQVHEHRRKMRIDLLDWIIANYPSDEPFIDRIEPQQYENMPNY